MLLGLALMVMAADPEGVALIWGPHPPKPMCVTAAGRTVCAETPAGVCIAKGAVAKCFDPNIAVLCAYGADIKRPSCLVDALGQIACGYDCKATNGKIQCAATPRGHCNELSGAVTCSDPPIEPGELTACFRRSQS